MKFGYISKRGLQNKTNWFLIHA